jgi:hypothetical protein
MESSVMPDKEELPPWPIGYVVVIDTETLGWWTTKFVYSPEDGNDWLDYFTQSCEFNLAFPVVLPRGFWN